MNEYGITEKEIKSLLAYQGAAQPTETLIYNYFKLYEIINMLLFPGIENEKIRLSDEERDINEENLNDMEEILSIYQNLYSAICKYTYRRTEREKIIAYRDDRELTYQGMQTGENATFLSATLKSGRENGIFQDKVRLLLMDFTVEGQAEYLEMNKVLKEKSAFPKEEEILFPPFLQVSTEPMQLTEQEQQLTGHGGEPVCGKCKVIIKGSDIVPEKLNEADKKYLEELHDQIVDPEKIKNAKIIWRKLKTKQKLEAQRVEDYVKWKEWLRIYLRKIFGEIKYNCKRNILIITSSVDETATYIMKKYSAKANFFRMDVDRFDLYEVNIENGRWMIKSCNFQLSSDEVYSIYYRKPMLPDLSAFHPQYHGMIQRDIISIINGIVDSFHGKVLTRPSILRKTENKIFQLLYASENDWLIPQSYIGNCKEKTTEFRETPSIIKPLTTGKTYGKGEWELYQTSIFKGISEEIGLTPVYLQSYIPKQFEVRITIIEQNVYPVRIDTENKVDWRADYQNHKYTVINCPDYIVEKCCKMMKDYELQFGAFDFVVTPENEWVFLEVNPNGQWLWLEQSLNLDISKKITEYLVR